MKNTYIFAALVIVLIAGILLYVQVLKPTLDNRMVATVVQQPIQNTALSFGFTYPSGEAGYTLIEPPVPTTTSSGLQKIYLLMNTEEYIAFQGAAAGETPPTVSIFVLRMPASESEVDRLERLRLWAAAAPEFSSYSLRTGEPEEIEIDGLRMLRYSTEGLYQQQVYLTSYDGNIYVFTGQFTDQDDAMRSMFNQLIGSLTFN